MKETFGQRFARLRKEKGLTQGDIAKKVNVSEQAVSKWETDINMPDVGLLLILSEILGVTTDVLLGKEIDTPAVYVPSGERKDINKMMLRIIVDSKDGDKVRCNFPLALVKICLDSGLTAPEVSGNSKISSAMNSIDWKQIYSMVEQGLIGEIITIDSADGDTVRIVVE